MGVQSEYTWICDRCDKINVTTLNERPSAWSECQLKIETTIWKESGLFHLCDECSHKTLSSQTGVYVICDSCIGVELRENPVNSKKKAFDFLLQKPLLLSKHIEGKKEEQKVSIIKALVHHPVYFSSAVFQFLCFRFVYFCGRVKKFFTF